jgi:cytochrome c553
MKKILFLSVVMSFSAFGQDAAQGKKIYDQVKCSQCHGVNGEGKAAYVDGAWKVNAMKGPQITGLSEEYIYTQLKAIQDKKRPNPAVYTSMRAKITKLTDDDFKAIAKYLSSQPQKIKAKGMLEK